MANLTGIYHGATSVGKVQDGAAEGTPESFILEFTTDNAGGGATTFIFQTESVNLSGVTTTAGIASAVIGNGPFGNWVPMAVGGPPSQVKFTYNASGDQGDITAGSFLGTYTGFGILGGSYTQGTGSPAQPEIFEVTYPGGYSGSTLIFDSKTVTAGSALTAAEVATAVAGGIYTG